MALDPETFDALIDTVRRFVTERLRPLEGAVEEADAIPADVVQEMRELGLFGLSIAEEYGGLGLTMLEEAKVAIELGRTTPAFRSTFGTNVGIGSQGLVMAGNAEQRAAWLPKIASGEIITSFALTEPDIGSDSGAVKTRAVFDGQSYRLSGTKRYITNADKADLFTVMARTGDEPGARDGDALGHRTAKATHVFDDVIGSKRADYHVGLAFQQDRGGKSDSGRGILGLTLEHHVRIGEVRQLLLYGRAMGATGDHHDPV